MHKRIISIILALAVMFSLAAVTGITANAYEYDEVLTSDDFEYDVLDDGTLMITRYIGTDSNAVIPSEIDGKIVTRIGVNALYDTPIYNNESNWENGVLYIGEYLITGKRLVYNEYTDENDTISEVKGDYKIKDGTRVIADWAFELCESLTSITIPDSVTNIGDYVCWGCTSLTSVMIGNGVSYIGYGAFEDCIALDSIKVSVDNENYCSQDGVLFDKYKYEIIKHPSGKSDKNYTIPDDLVIIDDGAFCDCDSLEHITIPNSVTSIGEAAFSHCTSLTSITIPDSVKSIDYYAFYDCTSLESATIGNNVTSIGDYAFDGCTSLTSVTIPNSVTSIGDGAFDNTALFNNVSNWEDGVLYIGNCLISGKLEIYNEETYEHDVISEVKGDYKIKDGTRVIADWAFELCESLTSIIIPDSVTNIGYAAFYGCESLTSVIIPNSITSISDGAFNGCKSLASVIIPNSVTSIGGFAFKDCTSLASITIPDSVTHIGFLAFSYTIPDCGVGNRPDFHIYCYADTEGEQYAIDNEFDYTLLKVPAETPSVIITQPTAGAVKKTENSDGTVTLTATANQLASFANWVIDGEYEIVEGSLTSETITIRPKADGIKISTVFDLPTTGTYGDVNYDGKVNMLDVLLIRKYIAKQPIDLDENLADVTCDGKVNMLDVLLIRKYIAKQPVTLGPKG